MVTCKGTLVREILDLIKELVYKKRFFMYFEYFIFLVYKKELLPFDLIPDRFGTLCYYYAEYQRMKN